MPSSGADIETVRQILLSTPSVKVGAVHGSLSFKLRGRMLACAAIHKSAEPNSLVVALDKAQRAARIAGDPALYISDHYAEYDVVLLRLDLVSRRSLRTLLEDAVRFVSTRPVAKRLRAVAASADKRVPVVAARRRGSATAK